ncbi:hypothetical protein H0X09_02150 [Candidatus Saccharibacteria bacterium]|nr:hypothetical protein [Candidatus Saccharibacteria bacterium]
MNSKEFTQNAFKVAAEAKTRSVSQMLEIRQHQPLVSRLGKIALGKSLAAFYPPTLNGYPMLGGGCEQVVYASDTEVLKVIGPSVTFSKREARQQATKSQLIFDGSRSYLGGHLLETSFEPIELRGLSATMAIQPRITEGHGYQSSEEVAEMLDEEYNYEQLSSLYESISELHKDTSLYPDIIGPNNIYLTTANNQAELVIVDTELITREVQSRPLGKTGKTAGGIILSKLIFWQSKLQNSNPTRSWSGESIYH